jgi:hypothetical protein
VLQPGRRFENGAHHAGLEAKLAGDGGLDGNVNQRSLQRL